MLAKPKRDLTSGSIGRNLWMLALPMMATNAMQTLFNVADMIFVGKLGPAPIAAVSLVGMIMMIPFSLVMGLTIAVVAMVSRYYGARNYDNANHAALQAIKVGILCGLFLTVFGFFFASDITRIFGLEPTVHRLATLYLQIIFIASVPFTLQFITAAIFQAVGDAQTAFWIIFASVILNVLLDPLMIFGIGPFPRMEIAGAAWATSIARAVGMVTALTFLIIKQSHIKIKWEGFRVDWAIAKQFFKIGIPGSLQMTLRSTSGMIFMGIVAGYGTAVLASFGVGIRIDMLDLMPGFGLGAATATLVGQNLGAQKPHRAAISSWTAAAYYSIFMLVSAVLIYIFAENIIALFNNTQDVIQNGRTYLHIIIWTYPLLAFAVILNRALGGAGETVKTMLVTGFSLFCVAVPCAFFYPALLDIGVKGIWFGIATGHFAQAVIVTIIFSSGHWKHKKV
ncbi:MATE family efflux transporter [candidate division KSB1 bacterium]|nr:MATE family efflux transporter [candidate division KSB1 bacterium]